MTETERYISVTDDEYVYFLDTESEDYKTLEDFEKQEFEDAKKENVDIKEYEEDILQFAHDKYWDYVYNWHMDADVVCDLLNSQDKQIKELKEDNDQKFWKHRCMEQYNTTQVIIHELGLAIREGYEMSSKMRTYLDELKEIGKEFKRLEDSV